MDQYYLFLILAPIATAISGFAAVYTWRRRLAPGALMLSLSLMTSIGWIISNSFELISITYQANIFIAKFSYLFILSAPVFWLGFALHYTGKQKWLSYPRFLLFWLLPAITFALVQTN